MGKLLQNVILSESGLLSGSSYWESCPKKRYFLVASNGISISKNSYLFVFRSQKSIFVMVSPNSFGHFQWSKDGSEIALSCNNMRLS